MVNDISRPALRRNGKEASCEPCRKAKARCDHRRPVCGRCQQHKRSLKCFYHPAPLTRKANVIKYGNSVSGNISSDSLTQVDEVLRREKHISIVSGVSTASLATGYHPQDDINGFLAQASSKLDVDSWQSTCRPSPKSLRVEQVASIAEVLGHLRSLDTIRAAVRSYYSASHASVIPSALILSALPSLADSTRSFNLFDNPAYDENVQLLRFSEAVLRSTSAHVAITASLTPSSFMGLFTGSNLRLEYLGIVFSVAARAHLLSLARPAERREAFMRTMFYCSTTCLRIARETTPINDMLVWLDQDYLMLLSCLSGDTSELTWRCLGDFCSDLLALGIHREAFNSTRTPFFLTECRRKVYAKAYHADKCIAALFDRPPRLIKRFSDTKWPLDLSDAEILGAPAQAAQALANLTPDGWNAEQKLSPSTFSRVRSITAEMHEEVLEYKLRPMTTASIAELKAIAQRNRDIWSTVPAHLRYTSRCWTTPGLQPQMCLLLCCTLMGFLESEFQLFQILQGSDADARWPLLCVAMEIVALVLELGSFRRKSVDMHQRFSYIILCHGLPPVIVLAKAAQKLAKSWTSAGDDDDISLPPEVSRCVLIRSLCVFVSQLDSISGPGEPNYDICVRASKAISEVLENVLDPPQAAMEPEALVPLPSAASSTAHLDALNFDAVNAVSWNELDMFGWVKGVDWTPTCDE